jgi:microcystin degradation protein MlrC
MGTRVLVVTDNDKPKAESIAAELGDWLWEHKESLQPAYRTLDEAIEIIQDALPRIEGSGRPIVLADVADNAGGGASSDSTFVLKALLDNGISNAIVGLVWDPMVVQLAEAAGVGARFPMRVGGKMSPLSGDPLDLDIEIRAIAHNSKQTFGDGGIPIGTVAILRAHQPDGGYVDIAANTVRCQLFHPDAFEASGVSATDYDVVIVKSMQHFHAGFAPIASQVEYIAAPGTLVPDFTLLPYKKARTNLWGVAK